MKKVFPTLGYFLKVISCSIKTVIQPIIGILSFIIDKAYDFFSGDSFIDNHDKTSFIKLFESDHHRNIDEYPFSAGGSCALSRLVGGVLRSILVMA